MRVVFMGTPKFSVAALEALAAAGHDIVAVYSQPPRKSGRGQKLRLSPVHQLAEARGWPVFTPRNLHDPADVVVFSAHEADIAVVVAYGLILPQAILDLPKHGCLNIHASLLPWWRGQLQFIVLLWRGTVRRACASCRWMRDWTRARFSIVVA